MVYFELEQPGGGRTCEFGKFGVKFGNGKDDVQDPIPGNSLAPCGWRILDVLAVATKCERSASDPEYGER